MSIYVALQHKKGDKHVYILTSKRVLE